MKKQLIQIKKINMYEQSKSYYVEEKTADTFFFGQR